MSELDRASLDRTLPPRSGSADWDEVLRGAGAGRERRGRRLVGSLRPCSSSSLARPQPSAPCVTSSATGSRTFNVASIPVKAREGALPSGSCSWRRRRRHTRSWRIVPEPSLRAPTCHGPVCARQRARADCPNRWPRAGVERAPRGLRDPPGRSEAARRHHDEGTPGGCVRAHPAGARSPEARLRHADLHGRHRVSQAGEFFTEPPRTRPASFRDVRASEKLRSRTIRRWMRSLREHGFQTSYAPGLATILRSIPY